MNQLIREIVFGTTSRPRRLRVGLLKGLSFEIDSNSKVQRLLGLEEKEIEGAIAAIARPARTALDVGANDGWYATYFAAQPNIAKVIACDPDQATLDLLDHNLRLNNLRAKVEVHALLVGSRPEPTFRSVDDLLRDQQPPFAIKIDVEGAELDVLESGAETLRDHECHLVIETHRADLERSCMRYLGDLGYETQVIPNGWYRRFVPEQRPLAHNRWMSAHPKNNSKNKKTAGAQAV
jgi:predicted RNA methylase